MKMGGQRRRGWKRKSVDEMTASGPRMLPYNVGSRRARAHWRCQNAGGCEAVPPYARDQRNNRHIQRWWYARCG